MLPCHFDTTNTKSQQLLAENKSITVHCHTSTIYLDTSLKKVFSKICTKHTPQGNSCSYIFYKNFCIFSISARDVSLTGSNCAIVSVLCYIQFPQANSQNPVAHPIHINILDSNEELDIVSRQANIKKYLQHI